MYKILTNFFLRLFHGSKLILESFKAYFYYPKLLLFPLFTGLLSGLAFFAIISLSYPLWSDFSVEHNLLLFVLIVFVIFVFLIIKVFMATSMAYAIHEYCQEDHASLTAAFLNSKKKWWLLIRWAAIELIVHLMAGRDEESQGSSFWDLIITTSWQLLTFFMYPLFALENLGLWGSLKRSTELMKKYGQTTLGSVFTVRALYPAALLLMLLFLFINKFILHLIKQWPLLNSYLDSFDETQFIVIILMPYLFTFFIFFLDLLRSAQVIASTVIYHYIQKKPTGIFDIKTFEKALD